MTFRETPLLKFSIAFKYFPCIYSFCNFISSIYVLFYQYIYSYNGNTAGTDLGTVTSGFLCFKCICACDMYMHTCMHVMYANSPLCLDSLANPLPRWISSLYLQHTVIILGLQHLPCSHVGSGDPNLYFLILMQHELYHQIISLALHPHDFL